MPHDSPFLSFALEQAFATADQAMFGVHANTVHLVENGGRVTEADGIADQEMKQRIPARYRSHGILGE